MTIDNGYWITDRTPTSDDANVEEEVLVFLGDDGVVSRPVSRVEEGTMWTHFYNVISPEVPNLDEQEAL